LGVSVWSGSRCGEASLRCLAGVLSPRERSTLSASRVAAPIIRNVTAQPRCRCPASGRALAEAATTRRVRRRDPTDRAEMRVQSCGSRPSSRSIVGAEPSSRVLHDGQRVDAVARRLASDMLIEARQPLAQLVTALIEPPHYRLVVDSGLDAIVTPWDLGQPWPGCSRGATTSARQPASATTSRTWPPSTADRVTGGAYEGIQKSSMMW
jgi:hypothetical protein